MTLENVFGPIVSASVVRHALVRHVMGDAALGADPATFAGWMPDYLRDVERETGREVGSLPLFESWHSSTRVMVMPPAKLPALVIVTPGLGTTPEQEGDGRVTLSQIWALSAMVRSTDADKTQALAEDYAAALRGIVTQQQVITNGIRIRAHEDEGYDELPPDASRSLAAGTVTVSLEIDDAVRWGQGPRAPSETPETDPGNYPTMDPDLSGIEYERR